MSREDALIALRKAIIAINNQEPFQKILIPEDDSEPDDIQRHWSFFQWFIDEELRAIHKAKK